MGVVCAKAGARDTNPHASWRPQGASGMFVGYVFGAQLAHNTIYDSSYTGISVGWGWGSQHPPGYGNNSVAFNLIYRVMRTMRDGGGEQAASGFWRANASDSVMPVNMAGIYVNGATNGATTSSMANNYITADENVYAVYYLGACIALAWPLSFAHLCVMTDNGSSHWHVSHVRWRASTMPATRPTPALLIGSFACRTSRRRRPSRGHSS